MSDSPIGSLRGVLLANQKQARRSKGLSRRRGACEMCKQRKVRCDGGRPCSPCRRASSDCRYERPYRAKRGMPINSEGMFPPSPNLRVPVHSPVYSPLSPPTCSDSSLWMNAPAVSSSASLSITVPDVATSNTEDHECWSFKQGDSISEVDWADWNKLAIAFELSDSNASDIFWVPDETFSLTDSCVRGEIGSPLYDQDMKTLGNEVFNPNTNSIKLPAVDPRTLLEPAIERLFPANLSVFPLTTQVITEHLRIDENEQKALSHALSKLTNGQLDTSIYDIFRIEYDCEQQLQHDSTLLRECINACYSELNGIGLMIDQQSLEGILEEKKVLPSPTTTSRAFTYGVLALGSHILGLQSDFNTLQRRSYGAPGFFSRALELRQQMVSGRMSLQNLQFFLILLYFSIRNGSSMVSELMMYSIQCVQALRLNSHCAVYSIFSTEADQSAAKRTLCFLYLLEKQHCLRQRLSPVLGEDFIEYLHLRSSNEIQNPEWLSIQCQYSLICSNILHELCGQNLSGKLSFDKPNRLLRFWKEKLSFPIDISLVTHDPDSQCTSNRRLRLKTLFQYHEALIAMGLHDFEQTTCASQNAQLNNNGVCVSSARDILTISCHITATDILCDWTFYHLICIATYVIFVSIMKDPRSRKELSYLGMAAGFFARLSLTADVPFEEVTELSRLAGEKVKAFSQLETAA